MGRVIFIRHGETLWNIERRNQGFLNSPLSELGEKQGHAIAERLQHETIDHLYSSDLGRAVQTATFIADVCDLEIKLDIELRERNMGIFQGHTREEVMEKFPEEYRQVTALDSLDYVIPDGESHRQRLERSIRVMNRLADQHPDKTIVVVSHSGILRGFFEHVIGLPEGGAPRFIRPNCALNSFIKNDGAWMLETWGDVAHLQDL